MAKLYPPYIEGTLPAFSLDDSGNGTITIPFELNKAVSKSDINGAYIKVKTVQSDVLIETLPSGIDIENKKITLQVESFKVGEWELVIGQYYKIQAAFVNNGEIGYYSTVGVIKCTSKPELKINDFERNIINNNNRIFIGQFRQAKGKDVTEKVYSSKFTITDSEGNEIATTGDMLHNVENNPNSYTSTDTMIFNRDLESGKVYTITYTVTTNNGLVESVSYLLEQPNGIETDFPENSLIAKLNKEDGYIELSLTGNDTDLFDGAFLISRNDTLKPNYWEPIAEFALQHENLEDKEKPLFRDFTIEQGKTYIYSVQQYNQYNIYSDRVLSNKVYADFDDMFLYDGKRQLKIQFNPQVGSFKTQLAETRTETIGSKYPFFFRNARVGYKTFPISGLISMFIDDNQEFITYDEILREDLRFGRHSTKSNRKEHPEDVYDQHWEIDHNFVSERLFKLAVLDWFNDGKVKLFKSPGEGNYLVRLMDTSLTPQTQLGRMLHTINATAYECAECNYETMLKYGIIKNVDEYISAENAYVAQWAQTSLEDLLNDQNNSLDTENIVSDAALGATATIKSPFKETNGYYYWGLLDPIVSYVNDINLQGFMPGTKIRFIFAPTKEVNSSDYTDILIGATGSYRASNIKPIYQVYIIQDSDEISNLSGIITYSYLAPTHTIFNVTKGTISKLGNYRQFVGEKDNVFEILKTTKDKVSELLMANFRKRPVEYLFCKDCKEISAGEIFNGFGEDGYRSLVNSNQKFYWSAEFNDNDIFTDKSSMEHSPFSLYVLIDSINGQTIFGHENTAEKEKKESMHISNHMFEKYYIDRYLSAQTAEEMLINHSQNFYVLDAWTGEIYAGNDYAYNPTIIYKDEEINLKDIEKYDLDNLNKEDILSLGNGVYGEVYYNSLETIYAIEDEAGTKVYASKKNYMDKLKEVGYENYNLTPAKISELKTLYNKFDNALAAWLLEWNTGQKESEEEFSDGE